MVFEIDMLTMDTRTGLWCDTCLLPSVIEMDYLMAEHHTLRRIGGGTYWACNEGCGNEGLAF